MGEWLRRNGVADGIEFGLWRRRPQLPRRQISDVRRCRRGGSEIWSGVWAVSGVGRPQVSLSPAEGFELLAGIRAEVFGVGGDA